MPSSATQDDEAIACALWRTAASPPSVVPASSANE